MPEHPNEIDKRPKQPHILVVDDEVFILSALKLYFETNDYRVSTAKNGDEALEIFADEDETVDVAILDLVMPGQHGFDVLRRFKQIDPGVEVIIATGCGDMSNAVDALRYGAFDFITKPILDFDEDLLKTVQHALEARRCELEAVQDSVDAGPPLPEGPQAIFDVGESNLMGWLSVYEQMNRLVSEHAARPLADGTLDSGTLDAIWDLLSDGFGADAALVIRQGVEDDWECERTWGFMSPPRARDLWQTPNDETDDETDSTLEASVWGLTVRPMAASVRAKWSRVLTTPFHGRLSEPRLLLLFYREKSPLQLETSPLPLLAALLSWLHRLPEFAEPTGTVGSPLREPEAVFATGGRPDRGWGPATDDSPAESPGATLP